MAKVNGGALPVTIVAGFLGAGKTTLINQILAQKTGVKFFAMVNDFGELNIDVALIDKNIDGVVSLSNGCICCSLQGELADQIDDVLRSKIAGIDHLIIECSGLSDPQRISDILHYPAFSQRIQLNAIITIIDALAISNQGPREERLLKTQLAAADIVVVNKVDLVTTQIIDDICQKWVPEGVSILPAVNAQVPFNVLLGPPITDRSIGDSLVSGEDHFQNYQSWTWSSEALVDLQCLRETLIEFGPNVLRAKGIVRADPDGHTAVFQMVGSRVQFLTDKNLSVEGDRSCIVFIAGRGEIDLEKEINAQLRKSTNPTSS